MRRQKERAEGGLSFERRGPLRRQPETEVGAGRERKAEARSAERGPSPVSKGESRKAKVSRVEGISTEYRGFLGAGRNAKRVLGRWFQRFPCSGEEERGKVERGGAEPGEMQRQGPQEEARRGGKRKNEVPLNLAEKKQRRGKGGRWFCAKVRAFPADRAQGERQKGSFLRSPNVAWGLWRGLCEKKASIEGDHEADEKASERGGGGRERCPKRTAWTPPTKGGRPTSV